LIIPRSYLFLALALLGGAGFSLAGIGWGLPTREADRFLFRYRQPWSSQEILALAGAVPDRPDRAADISASPLDRRVAPIVANASDAERGRIVRRYRLMSYQPDEFTTFAALSQMKPGRGDLDPRMYKYGGLWIYPVGGLLKLASAVGFIRLTPDPAYYLDHPEAFGRFYIVARLYSAMWGLLGVVAVFLLVRRICGSTPAAFCAALCFMLMPVVVTGAHEAKPHLAGTSLMLWAVLAGAKYAESGRRATAVIVALLCGAAIAMVPSALPAVLVIPAMVFFRGVSVGAARSTRGVKQIAVLLVLAGLVYCATNPYVPINLIRDRAVLRSNFGNSSDFYRASATGFPRAMLLTGLGMSFLLTVVGGIGAVALAIRAGRAPLTDPAEVRRRTTGMLLAAVALPVGLIFVLFVAGQPADYARFALPLDAFLAIEAIVAVETFVRHPRWRAACFTTLVLTTAFAGLQYVAGFARDSGLKTSRTIAAAQLAGMLGDGGSTLASQEEPAPWSLPPVDLFRWQIVLRPRSWPEGRPFPGAVVSVAPADFPQGSLLKRLFFSTPISWADKPFRIQLASGKILVQ
jgi:hypothetical protein